MKLQTTLTVVGLVFVSGTAVAGGTKEQMARAFKDWCGTGVPSFDTVDKKALSRKLVLDTDIKPPMVGDKMVESKTWANNDKTGSYGVNAGRATNGGKRVQGCGVYFPDIDVDPTDYFSEALAIGKPYKRAVADDGRHLSYWNAHAAHTILMLTSGANGTLKGTALNSIQTLEPGQ